MEITKSSIVRYDEKKQILFVEIDNETYKAKVVENSTNIISLYIFNFKKTFTINTNRNKFIPAKPTNPSIKELRSPICGRVIKIHKKENDSVKTNEQLVTIESMKMENEILATSNSSIKTISVKEGDLVQQNQILIIFK